MKNTDRLGLSGIEKPAKRGGLLNKWWRGQDSNLRTLTRAELQSAAFNHSTTPPLFIKMILSLRRGAFKVLERRKCILLLMSSLYCTLAMKKGEKVKKQTKKSKNTKRQPSGTKNPAAPSNVPSNITRPDLYGFHAVREAWLNADRVVKALYITQANKAYADKLILEAQEKHLFRPSVVILDKAALEKILPKGAVHQGIALACDPLQELDVQDLIIRVHNKKHGVIALLDQVTDPHNVGAIMRSASAFGLDGLIMQKKHAPALDGVLAKTACGAVDHLPVAHATNLSRALEDLQEAGFSALAMDEHAQTDIGGIKGVDKIVIVLGSEGAGIRPLVKSKCDVITRLPTGGAIASLNVSNAAAVAFYALATKR